jgi:predicted deacetylase
MMLSSKAKYIIRLDDACPTMRTEMWDLIEDLFDEFNIRPVVGVIPDNRDPSLMLAPEDPRFWSRARQWQNKGWEVVMHGLHHVYHSIPSHGNSMLPLSDKSEFVGISLDRQKKMLAHGYSIMVDQGLKPRAFMAPSHTFDSNTLQALSESTDIRVITDGHAFAPFIHLGFTWVPQQIWRFRYFPFGYWCICLHPNTMHIRDIDNLRVCLNYNSKQFLDFNNFLAAARSKHIGDKIFGFFYRVLLSAKQLMP